MASTSQQRPPQQISGIPSLANAPILAAFRAHARAELLACLDSTPRPSKAGTALVLDPSLSGPLGLVAEVREFREHGVDKIYHLLPEPLTTDCGTVVYCVRPTLRLAEQIAAQIKGLEKGRARHEPPRNYSLCFVPRRSILCEKVLADEGVLELIHVRELPLPFFVLEEDILSLEQPGSFSELFLQSDRSSLHACAQSLARLQALYGRIPIVRGKGECSQVIVRMLERMTAALDDAKDDQAGDPPPKAPVGASAEEVTAAAAAAAAAVAAAAAAAENEADGGKGGGRGGRIGGGGGAASVSGGGSSASQPPQIRELLLIDRDVDLVTPLCTELTYEGLIHQLFGISNGYVDLEPEVVSGEAPKASSERVSAQGGKLIKKELNNNDPLYKMIRNLNFGELGPLLNRLARGVHEGYEERHQAQTVSQIRDYMKKLSRLQQEHKSLATHVALAERIQRVTKEASFHKRLECEQDAVSTGTCSTEAEGLIEELCLSDTPLPSVLRLLCLLSILGNGLKAKTLTSLQSELHHAYGHERLALTWPALTKIGMLKKHETRSHWLSLKKSLRLVVDAQPEHDLGEEPADLAYVYAGYAPLSVRLLHAMLAPPQNIDETMKLLPGPYFSQVAPGTEGESPPPPPTAPPPASEAPNADGGGPRPPVTLVVFVGGCTFAEIAALRWLGRNGTPRREYLIATTHICNGDTLIEGLITACENGLEKLDS